MLIRPPLVLDTDLISCFAWVKRFDIIERLYSGQMKVLPEVIKEISRVQHLADILEQSIKNNHIETTCLNVLGDDGLEFANLLGTGKFGTGEAAVMSYVRYNSGTVSSNNLKDVLIYCQAHNIALLGTRPIIFDAIKKSIISEADAELVWANMIQKKRMLPCKTVVEVMEFYTKGSGASFILQKY